MESTERLVGSYGPPPSFQLILIYVQNILSQPILSHFGYLGQTIAATSALVMSPESDSRCSDVFCINI